MTVASDCGILIKHALWELCSSVYFFIILKNELISPAFRYILILFMMVRLDVKTFIMEVSL